MVRTSRPPISNINNWRLCFQKKNALLNLINHEQDIHKIYLYPRDHRKQNINFLINKRESTGLKYLMTQKLLLDTEMI